MKDRTVTETAFDHPAIDKDRPTVLGVVIVYSQGRLEQRGHRVERPRTFGRDEPADVVIDDTRVSRAHVRLEPYRDGVLVTDLGSRNGTFVNGERVDSAKTKAPLGTVIRVGKTLLLVRRDVVSFGDPLPAEIPGLIGGPELNAARMKIAIYADSPNALLIEGETGTGKEVVAAAIHDRSGRTGEFVALNCAAISPELVESELFGHTKGAFSGSSGVRQGLFRTAHEGTLLLDELGELPRAIQSKLLRVLETSEVRAVGGDSHVSVDVRVLAATNRDLDSMVVAGGFRGDLLHRVAALRIQLPPLRERLEDVPTLCRHFLAGQDVEPDPSALELLMRHPWPGNVRELRHAINAAATIARKSGRDRIRPEDIPEPTASHVPQSDGDDELVARVKDALGRTHGNVTHAATELQMARSRLYELLKRFQIDASRYR